MKGAYILLISNETIQKLHFGKTLEFKFPIGFYIYIGSAMGNGSTSLEHRLHRHVTSAFTKTRDRPHWHIDYLLVNPHVKIVSIFILPNSMQKDECDISRIIQHYSDESIPNFGSSDCLCSSHLYFFTPTNSFIQHLLEHDKLNFRD